MGLTLTVRGGSFLTRRFTQRHITNALNELAALFESEGVIEEIAQSMLGPEDGPERLAMCRGECARVLPAVARQLRTQRKSED